MSDDKEKLNLFQLISSVSSAMFGVQNDKTRERDFARGNLWQFIVAGLIFALVFIGILVGVVKLVLS